MKRLLMVAAAMAVMVIGIAGSAQAVIHNAYGFSCSYATDQPNFTGWVTLDARSCPFGGPMTKEIRFLTAWRWSNTGWSKVTISEFSRVYVSPFGSGWSWIWKQDTGWLAIHSRYVLVEKSQAYGFGDCNTGPC